MRGGVSTRPFREDLPRLLAGRGITLRALARELGGFDHGYLSRMLRGEAPVNPSHARRIAHYLDLGDDYFPEVREAQLIEAIRRRPRLRDKLYAEHVKKQRA